MGKVNCSVRGETWNWPLNDSDLPDIPPWDPDHGRLLACKVLTAGATAKVGYAEETAFVAWEDDSGGEHLGTLTEKGVWSSWTISGNTDFVGIAGLSANRCLLAYEDRFYVINTSTPAVEYEYALWSATAGWTANDCVDAYDFVVLPLIQPGDIWTGMFMMAPKSYDGTDEYFCAGVLRNTNYIRNEIRAVGNGGLFIQGMYPADATISDMAWVDYSTKSASITLNSSYNDVETSVRGIAYGNNVFIASQSYPEKNYAMKTDMAFSSQDQISLGESSIRPLHISYAPLSDKLLVVDNAQLMSMTPSWSHGMKTVITGYYPHDFFCSFGVSRITMSWTGASGCLITLSSGLFPSTECTTSTRSAISTIKATLSQKEADIAGANAYTVSGSLASPSTAKSLSFSAD